MRVLGWVGLGEKPSWDFFTFDHNLQPSLFFLDSIISSIKVPNDSILLDQAERRGLQQQVAVQRGPTSSSLASSLSLGDLRMKSNLLCRFRRIGLLKKGEGRKMLDLVREVVEEVRVKEEVEFLDSVSRFSAFPTFAHCLLSILD